MKSSIMFLFLDLLFLFDNKLYSQEEKYTFSKWDDVTKNKANTAKNFNYLSEKEKKIIYLMNLARMNGSLFAETFVQEYIDNPENGVEINEYVLSLINDLKKIKKLVPLYPQI